MLATINLLQCIVLLTQRNQILITVKDSYLETVLLVHEQLDLNCNQERYILDHHMTVDANIPHTIATHLTTSSSGIEPETYQLTSLGYISTTCSNAAHSLTA